MVRSTQSRKPTAQSAGGSANPFARALAETEKGVSQPIPQQQGLSKDQNSLFSQALAKSGDKLENSTDSLNQDQLKQQQEEAEKKAKKERQRKKLHDRINPVDMIDVFNNREKKVKEEIEKLRKELKLLAQEIANLHKDVDIAVTQEVVNPGQDGTYYISFFQKLRTFIMLLRQKVRSARTWAQQMHTKKKKKKRKGRRFGAGIDVSGGSSEQSKSVHDMMHHEQSTAYSGG